MFWCQSEKGREKGNSVLACETVTSQGRISEPWEPTTVLQAEVPQRDGAIHTMTLNCVTHPFPRGVESSSLKAKGWAVLLLGGGRNSMHLCSPGISNTSVVLPYIGQQFQGHEIAGNRQSEIKLLEEYKVVGCNLYRSEPEDEADCKNKEIQACTAAYLHDLQSQVYIIPCYISWQIVLFERKLRLAFEQIQKLCYFCCNGKF